MRAMQTHASRQLGFTLIELMVTIGIAALLLGIAAPSFREMAVRNRLSTYTNELISTINVARSEAVRRGTTVTICSSKDAASCAGTWNDGWIVFVDLNDDKARDPKTEVLVKAFEALAPNYSLGTDAVFATSMTYRSDGSASNTGMFAFCHDDEIEGSRALIVTPLRPRVARDKDNDRIPNRDDGTNIDACDGPGA